MLSGLLKKKKKKISAIRYRRLLSVSDFLIFFFIYGNITFSRVMWLVRNQNLTNFLTLLLLHNLLIILDITTHQVFWFASIFPVITAASSTLWASALTPSICSESIRTQHVVFSLTLSLGSVYVSASHSACWLPVNQNFLITYKCCSDGSLSHLLFVWFSLILPTLSNLYLGVTSILCTLWCRISFIF